MAKATCEFRGDGSKRPPVSREYVSTLESRIAHLETFLSKLKSAPSHDRDGIIDEISLEDHLSPADGLRAAYAASEADMEGARKASFQENIQGDIFHGSNESPYLNCRRFSGLSWPN